MALVARVTKEGEWFPYQPEFGGNREDNDPLILDMHYASHSSNLKYADDLKTNRKGNAKKGEVGRISALKFKDNIRVKAGFLIEDDKKAVVPSTDIDYFWNWAPQELVDELNEAMQNMDILEAGNPKNFKLKK